MALAQQPQLPQVPAQGPSSSSNAPQPAVLPVLNSGLLAGLKSLEFAFCISDAQHPDMPILFASDGFYSATGYSPAEVIGRNCRFLQGPETERQKVMEIRDAIREDRCCQVCLLNYRKNGSTFLNQFFLSPIKNDQGIVTHYVGIQTDVSAAAQAGLLDKPEQMTEQQAAVALGTAAGCSTCDMVMQQQAVKQQLQQHGQQQQAQQQQQQAVQAQQAQGQPVEGVSDVVVEEAAHAGQIADAFQQSPPSGCCNLPASLMQSLLKVQAAFVLSDPRQPDCPIVHASPEFLALTGYSKEEVEGRNCRFLQGADTDAAEVARLGEAMTATPPKPVTVTLLNYRKDGTPFWNALHIAPVRDAEGVLEYFIGVQLDVTQQQEQEHKTVQQAAAAAPVDEHAAVPCKLALRHKMAHMTATGAVRVACRGLSGSHGGLRRSMEHQSLPQRGYSRSISTRTSGACSAGSSGSFGHAAEVAATEAAAEAAVAAVDGEARQG